MTSNYILDEKTTHEDYVFLEKIGQPGQFGFAQKCKNRKTGEIYAAKVIDKNKFKTLNMKKAFFNQLENEVKIMQKLDHPNIIKYYDFFENDDYLYIIMELCEGGELFDRISAKGSYSEMDAAEILRQIMSGIDYLHSKNIAHLDLKPDNFLFLTEDESSQLKIIDFGMSKVVQSREYLKHLVGTPYYVAPEVLEGSYTSSCDIWSVGVIMFILLFGYPPFYSDPNDRDCDDKIFKKIKTGFQPVSKCGYGPWFPTSVRCSESAKDLITKLLLQDHVKRLTAKEALEHSWIQGKTADTNSIDKSVISGIVQFKKTYKLKNAFLHYLTNSMDEKDMKDLKKQFERIDSNKNGRISFCELKEAFKGTKLDEKDIMEAMKEVDVDNDGSISYNEWCMVAMNKRLLEKEERLWNLFKSIDTNNDGKLSPSEIKEAMKKINSDFNVEEAIAEVDIDGDGNIDYSEFLEIFKKAMNKSL